MVLTRRVAHFLDNSELLSRWPIFGEGGVGSVKTLVAGRCLEWPRIWILPQAAGEPQKEALGIQLGEGNYLKMIEGVLEYRGYR